MQISILRQPCSWMEEGEIFVNWNLQECGLLWIPVWELKRKREDYYKLPHCKTYSGCKGASLHRPQDVSARAARRGMLEAKTSFHTLSAEHGKRWSNSHSFGSSILKYLILIQRQNSLSFFSSVIYKYSSPTWWDNFPYSLCWDIIKCRVLVLNWPQLKFFLIRPQLFTRVVIKKYFLSEWVDFS